LAVSANVRFDDDVVCLVAMRCRLLDFFDPLRFVFVIDGFLSGPDSNVDFFGLVLRDDWLSLLAFFRADMVRVGIGASPRGVMVGSGSVGWNATTRGEGSLTSVKGS